MFWHKIEAIVPYSYHQKSHYVYIGLFKPKNSILLWGMTVNIDKKSIKWCDDID